MTLLAAMLIGGCATIFKGSSTNVAMNSDPKGAKVFVNGKLMGTTPLNLKLETYNDYNIRFEKKGFSTRNYNIGKMVGAGWIILDILAGGVPIIVDAITGSWFYLDTDEVSVSLEGK